MGGVVMSRRRNYDRSHYALWCRVMRHRWYQDPYRPQGAYRDGHCRRCERIAPPANLMSGRPSNYHDRLSLIVATVSCIAVVATCVVTTFIWPGLPSS